MFHNASISSLTIPLGVYENMKQIIVPRLLLFEEEVHLDLENGQGRVFHNEVTVSDEII